MSITGPMLVELLKDARTNVKKLEESKLKINNDLKQKLQIAKVCQKQLKISTQPSSVIFADAVKLKAYVINKKIKYDKKLDKIEKELAIAKEYATKLQEKILLEIPIAST